LCQAQYDYKGSYKCCSERKAIGKFTGKLKITYFDIFGKYIWDVLLEFVKIGRRLFQI